MRLINDIKLDFKDVLILPKRSTLPSRNEVDLMRTYTFINSVTLVISKRKIYNITFMVCQQFIANFLWWI